MRLKVSYKRINIIESYVSPHRRHIPNQEARPLTKGRGWPRILQVRVTESPSRARTFFVGGVGVITGGLSTSRV